MPPPLLDPQEHAEIAAVRLALERRWLSEAQLREALLLREELRRLGRESPLLPILGARFLAPEHLPALRAEYRRAAARRGGPQPTSEAEADEAPPAGAVERSQVLAARAPQDDPPAVQAFMAQSGEGT